MIETSRKVEIMNPRAASKHGTIVAAAVLLAISAADVGRGSPPTEQTASRELQQVIANMLDTAAMSTAMTLFVKNELTTQCGGWSEAADVERMFPGFNDRMQSRVALEMRDSILRRIADLRHQYEDLLSRRLTPDDIRALLHFQEDPVSSQLRDPAFVESLKTAGSSGAYMPQQMLARMTAQRAFATSLLQSDAGRKFAALTPELEALKHRWEQQIIDAVAKRMPPIGDAVLQEYEQGAPGR